MLRALAVARGDRAGGRLGVASLGRKRGGGRPIPAGSAQARRKAFLQVSMEQNMGCAVGACLGCVVMDDAGRAAAGLPRGPGVRLGRARLGGRLVKAKRRVVTSRRRRRAEAPADGAPDQARDRAGRAPPAARAAGVDARPARRGGARPASRDRRPTPTSAGATRRSTCRSISGAGSSSRTRSSSPRARSATAPSTATSSRSSGSARSAARARRSGRASATRRRA